MQTCLGHYHKVIIVDDGDYYDDTDYKEGFIEYHLIGRHHQLIINMPDTDREWN